MSFPNVSLWPLSRCARRSHQHDSYRRYCGPNVALETGTPALPNWCRRGQSRRLHETKSCSSLSGGIASGRGALWSCEMTAGIP
jgi:hypothetical protein